MEPFISISIKALTDFLPEIHNRLKQKNLNNAFVSVYASSEELTFFDSLNHSIKLFEKSFYFEQPNKNFAVIGLDEALSISESGEGRFALTEKKIKEMKGTFINNWENLEKKHIPLFLGGMKFTHGHADTDWQDFNDSSWFIPEIMLLKHSHNNFIFLNFYFSTGTSKESIINKFQMKLEKLVRGNRPPENPAVPRILKSQGNSPKDKKKWKNLVTEALGNIEENRIDKVVLSRKVEMMLSKELNLDYVMEKFRESYNDCYLFIFHRGKSSFFGASPEKLAKFSAGKIEIDALAGSAARGGNVEEDEKLEQMLLNDAKNLNEHNIVIDYIRNSISEITTNFNLEKHCSIKKLANIQHLWSKITADVNSSNSMFGLLKELFPTPAVCGLPKDTALHLIKKTEGYKRGLYSGIIGWFNLDDEGEFAVALRSALITNNKLLAFAGGGIVRDSNPDSEFKETELKLKTILSLFEDGNRN